MLDSFSNACINKNLMCNFMSKMARRIDFKKKKNYLKIILKYKKPYFNLCLKPQDL